MKTIATKTFTANLVRERSITPVVEQLGEMESTMELFDYEDGSYGIEWDIPELDENVGIGIFCEENTKIVTDYDGVFDLSDDAIEFLEENGFNCDDVK